MVKWLFMRTFTERVIWPPIASLIGLELDPGFLTNLLLNNLTNLPGILDDFFAGKVKAAGGGLLNALLSQDMYVAGSIVLILSTLTVIGTLISDILLAWVDPRIRLRA